MRNLARNKQELWFANRLSDSYVTDKNGLKTGEKRQTYSEPVKAMMSVSIAQGNVPLNAHGITLDYTHTALTDDMNCPMDEESIVWYGIEPEKDGDPVPHNFVVIHKGESLNHLVFNLKGVDVS